MPSLEGQFRNTGFVELAQTVFHHAIVLLLGGRRERQAEALRFAQFESNAGILGGMGGGKETSMVAFLHIFAIGSQHPGVRTGLGKNLAQRGEIQPQRLAQPQALGQAGGIDVHNHVHQRLDLGRRPGRPDITIRRAQFFENGFCAFKRFWFAAAHQIERAFARLGDAGGHAGFERLRAGLLRLGLDPDMDFRRHGGAVDEQFAPGTTQQAAVVNCFHRLVIRYDGEDDIRKFCHFLEFSAGLATQFLAKGLRSRRIDIINRGHFVTAFFQPACHVAAHPTNANEANFFSHNNI